jgi:hypothetical protein
MKGIDKIINLGGNALPLRDFGIMAIFLSGQIAIAITTADKTTLIQ